MDFTRPSKLTLKYIESLIEKEDYYLVPNSTVTICMLTLKNTFVITGTSATINKDNFNKEKGEIEAKKNALDKIWELEGYVAKDQLFHGVTI